MNLFAETPTRLIAQTGLGAFAWLNNGLAILVVALLLGVYLGWIVAALKRSPYTVVQSVVYFGSVLISRLLWRAEVPSRLPLGERQGAVIVANHRSSVDPFFVQLAARRRVHWMVAAEFGRNPIIKWLYDFTQVIPTSRSGRDTAATKRAIELSQHGSLVGMFPEGKVNTSELPLLAARPGAILVAARAGVPVLPLYIEGSPYRGTALSPFFTPARVKVHVGEPIDLSAWPGLVDDRDQLEAASLHVLTQVALLGGHHDFQPTLAGRKWSVNAA